MEIVEDDTAWIRYGQIVERQLTNTREGEMNFSAWDNYPTEENPNGKF